MRSEIFKVGTVLPYLIERFPAMLVEQGGTEDPIWLKGEAVISVSRYMQCKIQELKHNIKISQIWICVIRWYNCLFQFKYF